MKSIVVFAIVGIVGLIGSAQGVDYCALAPTLCGTGVAHIGCGNTGAFASTCPAGRVMVNMTVSLKNSIVNRHNNKRNTIAGGLLPGFNKALKMGTMRWNAELATLAAYNVKRCIFSHDACRNTNAFHYSGQNIAQTWWSGGTPTDLSTIIGQIDAWWAEYKVATMANLNSFPTTSSPVIGHFTVMTAQKNTAVGCAAVKFIDPNMNNWNTLIFACNYARTNIIGYPMYTSGITASKCTTGKNPNWPNLCSLSEVYYPNVVAN